MCRHPRTRPHAFLTGPQAFAQSLNATHILRVAHGSVKLVDNLGLSAADFDERG